jgi:hypothetical protein
MGLSLVSAASTTLNRTRSSSWMKPVELSRAPRNLAFESKRSVPRVIREKKSNEWPRNLLSGS